MRLSRPPAAGPQVLHLNIQEALRLFPPLIMLMRYVKETFSVTDSKGRQFVIPKVARRPITPKYYSALDVHHGRWNAAADSRDGHFILLALMPLLGRRVCSTR